MLIPEQGGDISNLIHKADAPRPEVSGRVAAPTDSRPVVASPLPFLLPKARLGCLHIRYPCPRPRNRRGGMRGRRRKPYDARGPPCRGSSRDSPRRRTSPCRSSTSAALWVQGGAPTGSRGARGWGWSRGVKAQGGCGAGRRAAWASLGNRAAGGQRRCALLLDLSLSGSCRTVRDRDAATVYGHCPAHSYG